MTSVMCCGEETPGPQIEEDPAKPRQQQGEQGCLKGHERLGIEAGKWCQRGENEHDSGGPNGLLRTEHDPGNTRTVRYFMKRNTQGNRPAHMLASVKALAYSKPIKKTMHQNAGCAPNASVWSVGMVCGLFGGCLSLMGEMLDEVETQKP